MNDRHQLRANWLIAQSRSIARTWILTVETSATCEGYLREVEQIAHAWAGMMRHQDALWEAMADLDKLLEKHPELDEPSRPLRRNINLLMIPANMPADLAINVWPFTTDQHRQKAGSEPDLGSMLEQFSGFENTYLELESQIEEFIATHGTDHYKHN